jgi:glycosyltransferase involved in cell wall biosynthesis
VGNSLAVERRPRVAVTLEQCWHRIPGGTAQAALESVRALEARGSVDQVGVSAWHRHPPDAPWRPPLPVRSLPLPRRALYEAWHRARWPSVERATGPVDVIHATGMAVPPPSAPLVVTVHDLAFLRDRSRATRHGMAFFTRSMELARRDATLVIAPSEATIADCRANGFDPSRLRLVPWGIDPRPATDAEVATVRGRYRLWGRYVLFAGTIEPRKNLPRLLDAFARLDRPDVQLVLAGPQGWNEDLTARMAPIRERLAPVGFVTPDDLRALYAGADVVCYPSIEEGFGLPVLEAMAQGTAVVTSATTSTAEVGGDAAVLIEPTDVAAIADALRALLDDPDRRAVLGAAGRRRASEVFPWSATAAALEAVYREAATS